MQFFVLLRYLAIGSAQAVTLRCHLRELIVLSTLLLVGGG